MDTSIIFPNLHITLENVGKGFYIGSFFIAFYGVIIAVGMLLGVSFILQEARRNGYNDDKFLDICLITIVVGVLGARLYYVAFEWQYYKNNLASILNIRQGGLAIYGGVIAGIACVAVLCKLHKIKFLSAMDICIFGVVIGQICGRWGNFFNREVFGQYTDGLFAMLLPVGAVRSQYDITPEMLSNLVQVNGVDYISVHPTFLYESLWNLGVFLIMFFMRKRKKFDGQLFFTYLVGYGVGRFWIEGIRTDQLKLWGTSIPVSQLVAAIMVIVGVGLIIYNLKKE